MSKINSPIRYRKRVEGYTTLRPIKGDSDVYTVTMDSAQKNATVKDSSDVTVTEIFNVPTVAQMTKRLQQGFKSLGAVFPNLITQDIPFAAQEVQTVDFAPVPDAGAFTLGIGAGPQSASILFSDNLATITSKLHATAGLTEVTVAGSIAAGLTVTFPFSSGDVALMTAGTNTLVNGVTPTVITVTEVTPGG